MQRTVLINLYMYMINNTPQPNFAPHLRFPSNACTCYKPKLQHIMNIQDILGDKYFSSLKVAHILKRVNKVKNINSMVISR